MTLPTRFVPSLILGTITATASIPPVVMGDANMLTLAIPCLLGIVAFVVSQKFLDAATR
ncbi:MAG: hypothetical protein HRU11_13840, partial [Parvularculaceae bacterium]|nr:hypothetical protein [Parvularculaceae bacterium]